MKMIKKITLLVAFIALTMPLSAKVKHLSEYRGWKDCYSISNKHAEIIVCPTAGSRLLYYAIDGENIIFEDPSFNGYLLEDMLRTRQWADGGRFDIGPEALPPRMRDQTFMGVWSAKVKGRYEIELTYDKPNPLGVAVKRTFKLDRRTSRLKIEQTMTNISDETVGRHYWGRVFCKGGGVVELPVDDPKGWGGMGGHGFGNSAVENDRLVTKLDDRILKVGSYSNEGWLRYSVEGLQIYQTFKCFEGANYSDTENYTTIFYAKEDLCELEPVSPTIDLKPGESYTFKQEWTLKKIEE